MPNYAELMFTEAVKALQAEDGSRDKMEVFYQHRNTTEPGEPEIAFITTRESFYMATNSASGYPYIQHRGGPRGFLRFVGPKRIACADFVGNHQFVSMGNLSTDDRVSLFMMDYADKRRLKLQGRASLVPVETADEEVKKHLDLSPPAQRVLTIDIESFDWNCPKYIPEMFGADVIKSVFVPQITALQQENEALKAELEELRRG